MAAHLRWPVGRAGILVEATPFLYNAPVAATDSVLVQNVTYDPDVTMNPTDYLRPFGFNKTAALTGDQKAKISWEQFIRSGTATGTAGEIGKTLKACGMSEAVSGGVSVTYTPASSSAAPYSISMNRDGQEFGIGGAFGTWKLMLEANKPGYFTCDFSGTYVAPSAVAAGTPTYSTVSPLVLSAASVTIDSQTTVLRKLMIDYGNEIQFRDDINASTGITGGYIANRTIKGSVEFEALAFGTYNPFTKLVSGATIAINSGVIGSTAGNRLQITQGACRIMSVKPQDMNGRLGYALDYEVVTTVSAAEGTDLSLVFT